MLVAHPKHHAVTPMGRWWAECSPTRVIACIAYAAWKYHQPLADAERVAWCESRDEPWANNGHGDLGLFQILYPSTWDSTPYARYSIWSPRWNALAAMWMWAHGRRNEWQCQ